MNSIEPFACAHRSSGISRPSNNDIFNKIIPGFLSSSSSSSFFFIMLGISIYKCAYEVAMPVHRHRTIGSSECRYIEM